MIHIGKETPVITGSFYVSEFPGGHSTLAGKEEYRRQKETGTKGPEFIFPDKSGTLQGVTFIPKEAVENHIEDMTTENKNISREKITE